MLEFRTPGIQQPLVKAAALRIAAQDTDYQECRGPKKRASEL